MGYSALSHHKKEQNRLGAFTAYRMWWQLLLNKRISIGLLISLLRHVLEHVTDPVKFSRENQATYETRFFPLLGGSNCVTLPIGLAFWY